MIYLWLKQQVFNRLNPEYFFEYSREHRQQRWYVTVLHKKSDVMIGNNILDDDIHGKDICLFGAFLENAIPAIEEYLMERENGEAEAIQPEEEAEGTAEPAGDEEDGPIRSED